jgi:uncharacterized ferritin-like protein (DUF455 family)
MLARLAIINLTHEAKGLDTFEKAKEKLLAAKDPQSASILDHNVQEEIGHVAAGVKWFKYACSEVHRVQYNHRSAGADSPAEVGVSHSCRSDCCVTADPVKVFHMLSKVYFKGKLKPPFNINARNEAGLTEEWYMPLV